ncbi:MAG: Tetracycline resistance protein, class C [Chlamydiae bacterium]|nr:Tetracycline resistance protein, class C [Chlamydiota bacterium]
MNTADKKSFISVLFIIAIDNFGFGLVFILFAPLMLNMHYGMLPSISDAGTRNLFLGLLFAVYPLAQFFGAPLFGDFADHFGRKKALYYTLLGSVIGFLLSGFSILATSYTLLLISRLITGFFAGNLSICMASIADLSPTEKLRARNFGIMTVVWGASWPFAMLAGGYLSDPRVNPLFNPALPFWCAAILTALGILVVARLFVETHEKKEKVYFDFMKGLHNVKQALLISKVRPYFVLIFFWTLGWGLGIQWFGSFSILEFKIPQTIISIYLVIQGAFWTLGGSLINPLMLRRFNSRQNVLIGLPLVIVLLIACGFATTYLWFVWIYMFAAAFASFTFANSNNLLSINAPAKIQGSIMGLSQSMMSLAWLVVPLAGGVMGAIDPHLYYFGAGFFMACGLLVLLLTRRAATS